MRNNVLEVLKKHLGECVEDIDVSSIDTSRSMKDYGVNSLDMIEVVSRSMRELKVRVPRAELNKIENIDGLVDLLNASLQQQSVAVGS